MKGNKKKHSTECLLCGSEDFQMIGEISSKPAGETDFKIPKNNYFRRILQCNNCQIYNSVHEMLSDNFYNNNYNQSTYNHNFLKTFKHISGLPPDQSDNKLRVKRVLNFFKKSCSFAYN